MGIGRALAIELADYGAKVAISARGREGLEEVAKIVGSERCLVLPGDVSDRKSNRRMVAEIEKAWGGLDLIILNAGTCEYVDIKKFDSSLFERTMQTNFMSVVYGIESALPLLRKSKQARIVGISSSVVLGAMPRAEAYGASKAAITHFLESLRIDLRSEAIGVTVVHPGFVRTPLTDRNDFPMPMLVEPDAAARTIARGIASGRHTIYFPRLFCLIYRLLGLLPSGLYGALVARSIARK